MATRSDLRGFLKQSEKNSERSSSYFNSAAPRSPSRKECCDEEEEEVVKYMSKLPGYLQGEESHQSSGVLNVGVLDWSRLEKWKHGRSTARASRPHQCKMIGDDHHHQVHTCSNLGKKVRASRDLGCTLEPELLSRDSSSSLTKQEMPTCSYKSSARDHERVKSRRRSPSSSALLLSSMGNSRGSRRSFMVRDKETDEKRAGEVVLHAQEEERQKQCVDGEDKTVVGGGSNGCEKHQEVSNIVLLRSTKQSRSTLLSSEQPPHMPCHNSKVARQVNRSLHLETDSSDDMMLPLLLGVDHSAKREPCGTRTTSQSKKRDPCSPSKRFSFFSFGRLSKSFTFREEDSSACPSQSSNPEENHQCGSRVTRLLDPLLKSKGSENFLHHSKPTSTSSNQDENKKKQDPSRTRALLQLTTRNGIPLFQFVVDDDDDDNLNKSKSKSKSRRSILGATMKSFKEDSVQYCTFYSVNEVKKKKKIGSWLIHQEKQQQKQHRFVYNVIGEMRLEEQKSESMPSVMRESVLVDETEEGVKGRKEVAAVVIKKKKSAEEVYSETTVIIPGGVHSIPEKGGPTPLIRRWRTGGCCDCGGWDVGCKLHVLLSNKTFLHDLFHQSFQLFHQEESDKKCGGPVLEMTEVKRGIYRVEFGSFLSHLQAFFVCVTVITCASEEEETVSKKSSLPFAPPLSPVGRA